MQQSDASKILVINLKSNYTSTISIHLRFLLNEADTCVIVLNGEEQPHFVNWTFNEQAKLMFLASC